MPIRSLTAADAPALERFVAAIPEEDRSFFKEDVTQPAVFARWLEEGDDLHLIRVGDDGDIEAAASVVRGVGRASHVGDLRLVVAPDCRGRGVARELGRRAVVDGLRAGLLKLTVEVAAEQQHAIDVFGAMGFVPEALLRDHLRSPEGELHDVVLMAHLADANWESMVAAGLDGSDA
jgi:ribosomal protein S18 acetylase RimI-like enzyme